MVFISYLCYMSKIEHTISQDSEENRADVIIVNGEAFTYKATGNTRRVFVNADKTRVIKVPVQRNYQHFNNEEIEIWNATTDEIRKELAETSILDNGYIMQEFLHTLDDESTPQWLGRVMTMKEIRFADACRSDVGYDKDGNLKCFDLPEYKNY